jgi:glycosyltransferase involved in cell wall biosynthesis
MFTGLSDSLVSNNWKPAGVPAIYRLLEALADAENIDAHFIFACKDEAAGKQFARCHWLRCDRLGGRVEVLPYHKRKYLGPFNGVVRELYHLIRCLWRFSQFRPDTAYCTNANFIAASVFANLRLCRTVLRFMGLNDPEKQLAQNKRSILRWLHTAPFDHVICTQDGSGAEAYLPRLLSKKTPVSIILNGVDSAPASPETVAKIRNRHKLGSRPVVLFLGRLEQIKGCDEFIEAMILISKRRKDQPDVLIVGDGTRYDAIKKRIQEAGLTDIIQMTGDVAHEEVSAYLAMTDIYVSLNKMGNLSNANLEAIAAGKCMIIIAADPTAHVDKAAGELLLSDIALRIPRDNLSDELATTIENLLDHPAEIKHNADRTLEAGEQFLTDWNGRIEHELAIIRNDPQCL